MYLQCYCYCKKDLKQRKDIEELMYCWSRGIIITINGRGCSYYQDFGTILQAISHGDYMRSYDNNDVGTITRLYLDKVLDNF